MLHRDTDIPARHDDAIVGGNEHSRRMMDGTKGKGRWRESRLMATMAAANVGAMGEKQRCVSDQFSFGFCALCVFC